VLTAAIAAGAPDAAHAKLLPPAGPWPAPVVGVSNPLTGTQLAFNGAYATPNASLRVWLPLGRFSATAITRAVGGRTIIRGQLRSRDTRRSISGAAVQLAAQNVDGGDWYLAGAARTSHTGRFRAVLSPGPTRRVAVLYWPHISAAGPVFSRRLLVRASARVFLRTSVRGRRITYRGRVSGAAIPSGGLLIAAQVRNGPSWVTVRLVRTHVSGRFVARYRFKYAGRRFAVRALAPSQAAWPLYSGHSHSRQVRTR
jgi:hypothetical protein